jgi:hypothetical protein
MVELSGDSVTIHDTCMTHCPDRLHYLVSMPTLILFAAPPSTASVSERFSCVLYNSFDVDSYLS